MGARFFSWSHTSVYRTAHRAVLPIALRALGDGASMVDYGIARAKYLDCFVENIKWSEVSKRFGK